MGKIITDASYLKCR